MKRVANLTASIAIVLPTILNAQEVIQPGHFSIAGTPFRCWNATTVLFESGDDVAKALPNRIDLNKSVFYRLPADVQAFIYAHECAHAHMGWGESKADCWAISVGKEQGFLSAESVERICAAIYFSPGDWTHFPGPVRCRHMAACFVQN